MRTITLEEQEQIEGIIKKCKVCYVGMSDNEGIPYVLPMNFGFHENVIYLHSAQEGKSISILKNNPIVCVTFCTEPELVWQNEEVACSYRVTEFELEACTSLHGMAVKTITYIDNITVTYFI
jgi:nitroimidazol reductase NimA-like FMN-containing flavoprotein (pyridoxamine 5'-phosphate oxidase superfamily)